MHDKYTTYYQNLGHHPSIFYLHACLYIEIVEVAFQKVCENHNFAYLCDMIQGLAERLD